MEFLQTPNPNFNNMPICPFIQGDLHTGNIKFMVYEKEVNQMIPDMDDGFINMIREWRDSDFKTGLILHVGDDCKQFPRKQHQKYLNDRLKENGMDDIKLLMFSPYEDFNIAGVDTRKKAPCVLYNLAKRKDLHEANDKLKKTKWYDKLLREDFKRLGIKKHKKIL